MCYEDSKGHLIHIFKTAIYEVSLGSIIFLYDVESAALNSNAEAEFAGSFY